LIASTVVRLADRAALLLAIAGLGLWGTRLALSARELVDLFGGPT
jgi:hypothetical protein